MRRIVLTGSECTGKSTLATELAQHCHAPCVPEFARCYVASQNRSLVYEDVDAIARGQIQTEDETSRDNPDMLFLDTDLLSTIVYSFHYYNKCPAWIEAAFEKRHGELYLLSDIDLPWTADGLFRDRPNQRPEMQQLFRDALKKYALPFQLISGQGMARFQNAIHVIDQR